MKHTNALTRLRFAMVLAVLLALGLAGRQALFAQTFTHNTTTLAAAQTATDTTISLTAVTAATGSSFGAVQAGQLVLVDQELETLTSVTATSTIWNVQRRGRLTSHTSGSPVYIGSAGSFQQADPPMGSCTTANQPKFWINLQNGGVFTCGLNSVWAKSTAPFWAPMNSGNGATVTLTAGQSGSTLLFDRAAGIVYTLPVPFPGMTFDFVQTVTVTSNSAEIATNSASVFIQGGIRVLIVATTNDFACNGTSHLAIKQNGTTTGGVLGGRLHFVAVSSTIWQVDGITVGSGTGATPCSTTT